MWSRGRRGERWNEKIYYIYMIHVFYGDDTDSVIKKTKEIALLFQSKEPEAALIVFEDDRFDEARFTELVLGGQSLFGARYIVLFRRVFDNPETKEVILTRLDDIKNAEHVFIFSERKIDAKIVSAFKKTGAMMNECSKKEKNMPEKPFASFALADAFGKRDKKKVWAIFHEEIAKGSAPESLHGMLFWQIKNMLLAKSSSQAECARAGMKPFVFGKAQTAAKNFSGSELRSLSAVAVSLYHRAHEGAGDLETATEQFILNI